MVIWIDMMGTINLLAWRVFQTTNRSNYRFTHATTSSRRRAGFVRPDLKDSLSTGLHSKTKICSKVNCLSKISYYNIFLGWVLPVKEQAKDAFHVLSRLLVEFNRQFAQHYNKKENSSESLSSIKDQIRAAFGTLDLNKIVEKL